MKTAMTNNVIVVNHPLCDHNLGIIRDKDINSDGFKNSLKRLATILVLEATKTLPTKEYTVQTPITECKVQKISDEYKIIFVVSDHLGATSQQILTYEKEIEKTGRTSLEALDLTSSAYGQIARRVLAGDPNVKAVYSTGAEYTLAVCRELKSSGLNILGQVLPLTAYGEILGGDFNGLKYVTSSSSATDAATITASIQYLKRKMEI